MEMYSMGTIVNNIVLNIWKLLRQQGVGHDWATELNWTELKRVKVSSQVKKKFVTMCGERCELDLLWWSFHNYTILNHCCTHETNIILHASYILMKKVKRQAIYFNNFQDLCYINALGRAELITDEFKKSRTKSFRCFY